MNQSDRAVTLSREACTFWFLWVTIATHVSFGEPTDVEPFFTLPDKLMHFVSFGVLAFLFAQTRLVTSMRNCWLLMAVWCFFDEFTQHAFPNFREFSTHDVLAGQLGIASFMAWVGALSKPSTTHIRENLIEVFAERKNWVSIFFIGSTITSVGTIALWYLFKSIEDEQYSSAAFFNAFLLATSCVLWFVICKARLQVHIHRIIKTMLPSTLVTIVLGALFGIATSFTSFDPWVVSMAVVMVGLRIAWDKAT